MLLVEQRQQHHLYQNTNRCKTMKTLSNMWNQDSGKEIPSRIAKTSFPANVEEAQKFKTDIIRAIYSSEQLKGLVRMLEGGAKQGKLPDMMGHLAASVVSTMLQRRAQEEGRKVHMNLLIYGLKIAIKELADIVEKAGLARLTKQDIAQAVQVAAQTVDQIFNQGQQPALQGPGPQGPMQPQPGAAGPVPGPGPMRQGPGPMGPGRGPMPQQGMPMRQAQGLM